MCAYRSHLWFYRPMYTSVRAYVYERGCSEQLDSVVVGRGVGGVGAAAAAAGGGSLAGMGAAAGRGAAAAAAAAPPTAAAASMAAARPPTAAAAAAGAGEKSLADPSHSRIIAHSFARTHDTCTKPKPKSISRLVSPPQPPM